MRRALAVALPLVALAAGCGGTKTVTVTTTVTHVRTVTTTRASSTTTSTTTAAASACAAGALQASFEPIEGSAGAGHISYALTLTNTSSSPCFVSGVPRAQLLGTTGGALPTTIIAEPGPDGKVTLQPNGSATAEARFSPDVAGQGDQQQGQCQPTATVLRVTAPGGGTVDAPVQPPTSVCERGSLQFRPFAAS